MNKLKKIFFLLNYKEKKEFFLVLVLMLVMALLDTLGVVSILPFIAVLSNPTLIETNSVLAYFYELSNSFGVNNSDQFLFLLGVVVFILLITSITIRSITVYFQNNFVLMLEYSISTRLIKSYLLQPYVWFLNRNSSDFGKNIISEVNLVVNGTMQPMMYLISQTLVASAILSMLFIVDKKLTFIVGTVMGLSYLTIFYFMKNILLHLGNDRVKANESRFTIMMEAFGGIKETKFLGLEKDYIDRFSKPSKIYARNTSLAAVIAQIPRNFIEGIAFGGMIILILNLMTLGQEFISIIPIIALYAFSGYRLLPALQQMYAAFTQLRFSGAGLDTLYKDIHDLEVSNKINRITSSMQFTKSITLKNVTFNYPNKKEAAIKNMSLSILAKSKVGIVGTTGSGKTTTIDIILGLLDPKEGNLLIDEKIVTDSNKKSWQKNIGYVPQQIYLSDDTISANIAFGLDKKNINIDSIEKAAKIANLHDFVISELPDGYDTIVGEKGIRLSGGQKQRIGIARALYNNPLVIIFDEATNSLDNITEQSVMDAIDKLSNRMTIILIAHRLSTVKNCDKIFLLEKGELKTTGKFEDLALTNRNFQNIN
jgi:ATP-binding cassette, subfamily B, bacterial PglK